MKVLKSLEGISDGKVYGINDMVKADAGGCEGCSACCHGVGEMVSLTPFDVFEITSFLNTTFEELLQDKVEMRQEGKIMLPHLKMHGESERCGFLSSEDRCIIHAHRPGICRLFPLGRIYEDDDIGYFLQVDACVKPKLGKVKVKKWIGVKNYNQNKAFILVWHNFLKALEFRMKFIRDEQELSAINADLLGSFYSIKTDSDMDFYGVFMERLLQMKERIGII